MSVAISGSRTFTDRQFVEMVVARLLELGYFIIYGDAPNGVDAFVQDYLRAHPGYEERARKYVAHWTLYGKAAGIERNGRMIRVADMLVAIFAPGPPTPGTSDALEQARVRGIPIYAFLEGAWTLSDPSGIIATNWLSSTSNWPSPHSSPTRSLSKKPADRQVGKSEPQRAFRRGRRV